MVKVSATKTRLQPVDLSLNPPNITNSKFESAIWNKGFDVVYEKAMPCPCITNGGTGHLPDCKNCFGSGWFYVNPTATRMLIHSMKKDKRHELFTMLSSEPDIGSVSVTTMDRDRLSYMDKITMHEAKSEMGEILFPKEKDSQFLAFTIYNPDQVFAAFLFNSVSQKHTRLIEGTDFSIDGRFVSFTNDSIDSNSQISIRYTHAPIFLINEIMRDSHKTRVVNGQLEEEVYLPSNYLAKRAHKIDYANKANNNVLDNSWQ